MAARAALSSVPLARIDRGALAHNYEEVVRLVGAGVRVLAMVKADAYGHGAAACTETLARRGCRLFGVATVDEARVVARAAAATDARVVVFGGIVAGEAEAAVAIGAEVATQEIDVVRALGGAARAQGREAKVHLKLDTGMHRLGGPPEEASSLARAFSETAGVALVGVCSHFALAESVTGEVTAGQLERMRLATESLEQAGFRLERHLANSAAVLTRPEAHLDVVRPGIALYGIYPDASLRGRAELRPVMTLEGCVVRVAEVPAGEGIGYGHTYRTTVRSRIATVRLGYADGYPRHLGSAGEGSIGGVRVPVVGRVCMDHTMFDVTAAGDVAVGDRIAVWGTEVAAEDVAARAGTIAYELVARVGARVRRVYE